MLALLSGCGDSESLSAETPAPTPYTVVVTDVGDRPINAIKTVREVTGLGLEDAKDLLDSVPAVIKTDLSAADARALAAKLESAGMTVEVSER